MTMEEFWLLIGSVIIIPPLLLLYCAPFIAFVLIVNESWRKLTTINGLEYTPEFFPSFFKTYFGVVWKSSAIAYGIIALGVINFFIYVLVFYFVLISQIRKHINTGKNKKDLLLHL
jgi:large-conductance mechanosensitive channel